jgi:hypothetical protein
MSHGVQRGPAAMTFPFAAATMMLAEKVIGEARAAETVESIRRGNALIGRKWLEKSNNLEVAHCVRDAGESPLQTAKISGCRRRWLRVPATKPASDFMMF